MKALRVYSHKSDSARNVAVIHDGKTILEILVPCFFYYKIDDSYFTAFECIGGSGIGYSAGPVLGKWKVTLFDQIDRKYVDDCMDFFHVCNGDIKELI